MKVLKIRQNDRYYQLGYYEDRKFILVEHLGTAEKVLKLVRLAKTVRTNGFDVPKKKGYYEDIMNIEKSKKPI